MTIETKAINQTPIDLPGWYYIENGELYWQWKTAYKTAIENLITHLDHGMTKTQVIKDLEASKKKREQADIKFTCFQDVQLYQLGFYFQEYFLDHFDEDYLKHLKWYYNALLAWKNEIFHPMVVDIKSDRLKYLNHE